MRFSKFRLYFIFLSLFVGVSMFAYTYGVLGGFARSITFNGGIRISLTLPHGMDKETLEDYAKKAGFKDAQVRQTDVRQNLYDLELGPDVRDTMAEELKVKEQEYLKKREIQAKEEKKEGKAQKTEGKREDFTVAGVIENKLLESIPELTQANIVSRETISASYGNDLFDIAFWSFVWTVLVIGLYLSFRFDFPFAVGASLALVHDIIMTIGFIGVVQIEPSIPVVAGVLTIVGYSINDTIVIFDRIRDNVEHSNLHDIKEIMDISINQTLGRTIITSLLTLIAVVALLLGGADSLADFAWVILFGIVVGTYSSIFIASHFVQYYEEYLGRFYKSKS